MNNNRTKMNKGVQLHPMHPPAKSAPGKRVVEIFEKHLNCRLQRNRSVKPYRSVTINFFALLMSAENTETLTFVSLKFCFSGFVPSS